MRFTAIATVLLLTACAPTLGSRLAPPAPVVVKIIGFNDFHGALEPPQTSVAAIAPDGLETAVPAGGAAHFASAIDSLKAKNPMHAVVSAGDMIGATPFISSIFLDEPTILAINRIGIDFNAVGNHEFDRGRAEIMRIQNGGCEKHTVLEPCRVDRPFPGANFRLLAANVLTESGRPLFPATGIKRFGRGKARVTIGFVGLTLKDTPSLVSPSGIAGLRFADEVTTINARTAELKRAGAAAVVVLIHEGLYTQVGYNDKSCGGASGPLVAIANELSPDVDLIVSGHSHRAYVCDLPRKAGPSLLVTSAGVRGTLVTDIDLTIDPSTRRVVARRADNVIVQGAAYAGPRGPVPLQPGFPVFAERSDVAAIVARYKAASEAEKNIVVGRIGGAALRYRNAAYESVLGNVIADAQLDAMRAPGAGGAQIALMNPDGIRIDLTPRADGSVTFGQLFAVQPFSNNLVTRSYTGAQLRAILDQGFDDPDWIRVMSVSRGFRFAFDQARPKGERIVMMTLDGVPVRDDTTYRIVMNSFLASGGDRFTVLTRGTDETVGPIDLDALRAFVAAGRARTLPADDRIENRTTGVRPPVRQPT